MIKDKNFYQVSGWMMNKLHLKGEELICYAIIYSLSQLGEGRYVAGLKYLTEFMQCSQSTASRAIKSLYKKGLIDKEEIVTDTGRRVFYFCSDDNPDDNSDDNSDGVQSKPLQGVQSKSLDGVQSKSLPINNNNKEHNNRKVLSDESTKSTRKKELTEEEKEYQEKMREKFPRIMKMEQPLTLKEAKKLKEKYNSDMLKQIMQEMENWKPLLKKSVSAYMTIINWCNREIDRA